MPTSIDRPQLAIYSAAAVLAAGAATMAIFAANKRPLTPSRRIIPSPRTTLLPRLSAAQRAGLAYPPDLLPNARDVDTPYGYMRVYEWGPETGRKVIFIHGDATPSPMFTPIANDLVARGCRVMMFDLWGRGYTDTPVAPHDSRLYTLQIIYAITSSPIAWTGTAAGRFSLVGFSMGGSISMDFFAHFPQLVQSIVLLGPGGLIKDLPVEYKSTWFQYPSLISKAKMRYLLGTLLGVDLSPSKEVRLSKEGFTPAGALQFQFDHHDGHLESFLSTIQHGPLQHQEVVWERAGKIISGAETHDTPLSGGQVLAICGQSDSVVPPEDVKQDLEKYLGGSTHFRFATVPGGHGFPWTEGKAIAEYISDFWGLEGVEGVQSKM